jgi:hypothetical protein
MADPGEGWISLHDHLIALRAADAALQTERDRRYAEVNVEREKALKIKETADLAALQLAREIQTYKDEKANELREQINSERGLYPTKDDMAALSARLEAMIKPLSEYVTGEQVKNKGIGQLAGWLVAAAGVVVAVIAIILRGA